MEYGVWSTMKEKGCPQQYNVWWLIWKLRQNVCKIMYKEHNVGIVESFVIRMNK